LLSAPITAIQANPHIVSTTPVKIPPKSSQAARIRRPIAGGTSVVATAYSFRP
jgi:hypothetical protein